ncbi:MAG: hypothetical protein APF84_05835 [Gracilibacter sp. BRH_c7a]|nr:MAG: hypothetical protein APF84_05835 [Gracilibacter sp. BRH_c7a]
MPYTFPTDSNNKAGAVKNKAGGNDFIVPVQETAFDHYEARRVTLTAETNEAVIFSSPCLYFDVQNLSDSDKVYAKAGGTDFTDSTGAETDTEAIRIKPGGGYMIPKTGTTVKLISGGTPIIQVIGVWNDA